MADKNQELKLPLRANPNIRALVTYDAGLNVQTIWAVTADPDGV